MKRRRFTEEQIAYALRQAESGKTAVEVCREVGVSENTFYDGAVSMKGWALQSFAVLNNSKRRTNGSRCWSQI